MDITDWRPHVERATTRLVEAVPHIADLDAPTLCAGWARRDVLSHLSGNAGGLARALQGRADGRPVPVYDSQEARDAEIETGAGAPPEAVAERLRATAEQLASRLAQLDVSDQTPVERTPGVVLCAAGDIPFARLREVVLHHVDLRADLTLTEVEQDVQQALLRQALTRLRSVPEAPSLKIRTDEGDVSSIGDATHHVSGSRAGVLLWLSRGVTEGVRADSLPALPKGL